MGCGASTGSTASTASGRGAAQSSSGRGGTAPMRKLLLITDIGRDIDDTLALLTLQPYLKKGELELAAVVTSGGSADRRAGVCRGWLRLLGLPEELPVAAGRQVGLPGVHVPPGFPGPEDAALSEATQVILQTAESHKELLFTLVIGPMTPLADALEADTKGCLRKMGGLYIQGQAKVGEGGRLTPDDIAFNLREDMASSTKVFEQLQDHVPFHLLGKHTAYAVKLLNADFRAWDDKLATFTMPGGLNLEMSDMAKHTMNVFRSSNPALFYKLYKVPEDKQNEEEWFAACHDVSMPYDALALLNLIEGHNYYEPERVGKHTLTGNTQDVHNMKDVAKTKNKIVAEITGAVEIIGEQKGKQKWT